MNFLSSVLGSVSAAGGFLGGGGAPAGPISNGPQTVTFGAKGTPSWVLPSTIGAVVIGAVVVVLSLNRRK